MAKDGPEEALVRPLMEELRKSSGIEAVKWYTPDGVMWNCPVQRPYYHCARLTFRTFLNQMLIHVRIH